MGRTRGKRAHAFQPERVPVGSSAEFARRGCGIQFRTRSAAPQVSGSGECSSVFVHPEEVPAVHFPATLRRKQRPQVLRQLRLGRGFERLAVPLNSFRGLRRGCGNVLQQPEETSGSRTDEFRPQPLRFPRARRRNLVRGLCGTWFRTLNAPFRRLCRPCPWRRCVFRRCVFWRCVSWGNPRTKAPPLFPQNESAALVPLRPPEKHTGTRSGVSGFSLFPGGNRRESVTAE